MNVTYKVTFLKDLKRMKGSVEFAKVRRLVFDEMPGWKGLEALAQVKRLRAKDNAYRIRVGDYRIGFFCDGRSIQLARVLHRKEVYRFFP